MAPRCHAGKVRTDAHPLYCCYAESDDGIRWRKPELGLFEFRGSKDNNIVLASGTRGPLEVDAGHPAVFKDENPAAPPAPGTRRSSVAKPRGLLPFRSPDGLHWSPMSDGPVMTNGAFDSQNLGFWDAERGTYRATGGPSPPSAGAAASAIRTATSEDFLHWGDQTDLSYADSPPEQMYTNQVRPYHRAPHILVGFPTRYIERGWSER